MPKLMKNGKEYPLPPANNASNIAYGNRTVESELDELNAKWGWTYSGNWTTAFGNAKSEVIALVCGTNSSGQLLGSTFHIPKVMLSENELFLTNGYYYTSSSYALFQLAVSTTTCRYVSAYFKGTQASDSRVYFYYR